MSPDIGIGIGIGHAQGLPSWLRGGGGAGGALALRAHGGGTGGSSVSFTCTGALEGDFIVFGWMATDDVMGVPDMDGEAVTYNIGMSSLDASTSELYAFAEFAAGDDPVVNNFNLGAGSHSYFWAAYSGVNTSTPYQDRVETDLVSAGSATLAITSTEDQICFTAVARGSADATLEGGSGYILGGYDVSVWAVQYGEIPGADVDGSLLWDWAGFQAMAAFAINLNPA